MNIGEKLLNIKRYCFAHSISMFEGRKDWLVVLFGLTENQKLEFKQLSEYAKQITRKPSG